MMSLALILLFLSSALSASGFVVSSRPGKHTESGWSVEDHVLTHASILDSNATCRPKFLRVGSAPSIGTLRAAVIFVDFSDAPANSTTGKLYEPIKNAPAQLYNVMSYGKVNLELVPVLDKFFRMPHPSSSYNYSRGLTTETHLAYINDALTAVGSSASFKGIDVLYVIACQNAKEISFSATTAENITAPDGTRIGQSITFGTDLEIGYGWQTVNHETGHAMGLLDLYPYDGSDVSKWVGGFDMMGLISGQSPDYFAWHKWQLKWISEDQVDCVTAIGKSTHRISPIEVASQTTKVVAIPLNSTFYVMAEVRSVRGIDSSACGVGVLLYTANSATETGLGPIRVLDTKPKSGGCGTAKWSIELNDAPLTSGLSWDTGLGVSIAVKSKEEDDYVIEVDRRK